MRLWQLIKNILVSIGKPFLIVGKFLIRMQWKYLVGTVVLLGLTELMVWGYQNIFNGLPNINQIYNPPKLSTKILDRNGILLYKFYVGENRVWVPLSRIPKSLIEATIAIEDKNFYQHGGLSVKGIITAINYDLFKKDGSSGLRGGSTITQQLIKNVFLNDEKTAARKIKEAILAVIMEKKLTKNEILERYFNQVGYGGETYGVEEASLKYFGKDVWQIDQAEAAFLAGLPAAPSSYSPFGPNPEYAYIRQKHVIEEMVNAKFIDEKKAQELKNQKITVANNRTVMTAPHFVFYIKDYLEKKFGYANLATLGLTIRTSLDISTQKMAEKIVREEIDAVKKLGINNGAAVVVDPKTGEILAMVGSKDYNAKDIDGKFNVTTGLRQPGSSIKPINYLLALMKGNWTLASTIDDAPITYQIQGQKPYSPQNYNGKFMGRVTLRTALASSLNIPSVKLLAADGVQNMIDLGKQMGISTWNDKNRFGLSLALGAGEVKMIELANAYSIFANLGEKTEINPILEISNYLGEKIYQEEIDKKMVIDKRAAFLINNVLADNEARAPIFGVNSKLKIEGKTVAVKTGTTNNLKDNWCIGWTPSVLTAVWVGNNDGQPMNWVASGISGATPIWNRIMKNELADKKEETWAIPEGVIKKNKCGKDEYFIAGTGENVSCQTITPTQNPTAN